MISFFGKFYFKIVNRSEVVSMVIRYSLPIDVMVVRFSMWGLQFTRNGLFILLGQHIVLSVVSRTWLTDVLDTVINDSASHGTVLNGNHRLTS